MTCLPVSGATLSVREPTGADEIYVLETTLAPLPATLELASRVAGTEAGDAVDWASLPVIDIAAMALIIRRSWIGDVIRTDASCPDPGCRERIDVSFGIGDYLEHHRPRQPRSVTGVAEAGWFTLAGTTVRFRLPTAADLLAVSSSKAAEELSSRCIDAPGLSRALARRLDRALSALAPNLDDLVGGSCPGCGRQVLMRFDPLAYTLAELRQAFSGIHQEAHALAAAYGWPEEAILALPRSRRQRYAAIIADERRAG
jgi:hypothetical protein